MDEHAKGMDKEEEREELDEYGAGEGAETIRSKWNTRNRGKARR